MCCRERDLEEGKNESELLIKKKPRPLSSPYLQSSVIFTLSSLVSFVLSAISCKQDGMSTANVGSLIANFLYLVGYTLYVCAEWKSPNTTSSTLPLINSEPKIQHM